jgi:diguanylate cyclase (GGDEF)-like protein
MRAPEDITAISGPSIINTRNLLLALTLALAVVFLVSSWGWTLRRKVRIQTAALAKRADAEAALERRTAQLEVRRSAILEEINQSRPLKETLHKIAEMASFGLFGAPCWVELLGDQQWLNSEQEALGLRVVRHPISSRSGDSLGALAAGFDPFVPAFENEQETLSSGARLAALAVETNRLNADLHRRSEFDLLTDIYNRFSLTKCMEELIEEAQKNAGVFGLIYIDLDNFKPVNDRYGHRIGDLYLQKVVQRMKNQLRGADMLARLGGDEFAALISETDSRTGVEEIAQRLERCFDEPFSLDGLMLSGSASFGIALYPEDGAGQDEILHAADSAMYAAKNTKRTRDRSLQQMMRI